MSLQQKPIIDKYAEGKIDVWMPAVNMIVRCRGNTDKTQIKLKSLFYDYGFVLYETDEIKKDLYELFGNLLHCQMLKGFCFLEKGQISQINEVIYKLEGKPKVYFEVGDLVNVKKGPWSHLTGKVIEVAGEKVKVGIFAMGRVTPIGFSMEMIERVI